MITKIKASLSEKIIFIFVLLLGLFFLSSFFLIKNKCLFVKDYDPLNITFDSPKNIAVGVVNFISILLYLLRHLISISLS